jgi:hypothetical protein
LIPSIPVSYISKNEANEVNAAEAIAKPFQLQRLYYLHLKYQLRTSQFTHFGNSTCVSNRSKASIANCIAVVAIIADAAKATP